MSACCKIDWEGFREKFKTSLNLHEPIRLPSDRDMEIYYAYELSGALKNPIHRRFDWAYYQYPGNPSYRKELRTLSLAFDRSGVTALSRGLTPPPKSHAAIIRDALQKEQVTTAFIISWAHIDYLFRRYAELYQEQEAAEKVFFNGLKKGKTSSRALQQVWHARWILKYAGNDEFKRANEEFKIAKLCKEIIDAKRLPPKSFNTSWFAVMLAETKEKTSKLAKQKRYTETKPIDLGEKYKEIKFKDLQRLAKLAIPEHALPPLSMKGFPKVI